MQTVVPQEGFVCCLPHPKAMVVGVGGRPGSGLHAVREADGCGFEPPHCPLQKEVTRCSHTGRRCLCTSRLGFSQPSTLTSVASWALTSQPGLQPDSVSFISLLMSSQLWPESAPQLVFWVPLTHVHQHGLAGLSLTSWCHKIVSFLSRS